MNMNNFILRTDAYKLTHWLQYPPGTRHVYSYMESRGGDGDSTLFFGLQYYLREYLEGTVVSLEDVDEAREFAQSVFGTDNYFNYAGWLRIVNMHGGRLPVRIRAVEEGTWIGKQNVMLTIENTDPELPWITNVIETLLMKLWYPISVASYSGSIYDLLRAKAALTGGEVSPFHLNDFGYRGVSSEESAGIGGMAHLVNFMGTDTLRGILFAQKYYDAEYGTGMSVFATEHSTTTTHLESGEEAAIGQYLDNAVGIASIVMDSYDTYRFVDEYIGKVYRDRIVHGNVRVVLRPDSGNPIDQVMYILNSLEKTFPIERNEEGYKLLHPNIGIIYGDFMSFETIGEVCNAMKDAGWAIDGRNVVFGMGGNLLQNTNRDTHQFALKCSSSMNGDGEWFDVYKDPKTMQSKRSKRGRLGLIRDDNGDFQTVPEADGDESLLSVAFENGRIVRRTTFSAVQKTAQM